MISFTTLIITLNEEKNIADFIKNFTPFSQEILVVDSFSTDKTVEIAKTFDKVKIVQRKFDNFTAQRNYALSLAQNDWILFFDADERINEELMTELQNEINNSNTKAFYIKRNFYYKEKLIRYSGFQNDYAIRVLNKQFCQYSKKLYVHEQVECSGEISKLKTPIKHYSFRDTFSFKEKLQLYSKLKAHELHKKKVKPNAFHFLIKPGFRFCHHYFIRLGFLDGKEGFHLARLFMQHVSIRYSLLKELHKHK